MFKSRCFSGLNRNPEGKRRVSKRGRVNEGRPTKATPERIASILAAIARGLTREQACAKNDVSRAQFSEWEKRAEFPDLREKALAERADFLLAGIQSTAIGWQRFAWLLERPKSFREQFADPSKTQVAVHLNQQINNLTPSQSELEEARARLDETKKLQEARARLPIIEIDSHIGGAPLAIEAPPEELKPDSEPKRPAPQSHSMRASDMDPLSGMRRKPGNQGDSVRKGVFE